MNNHAFLYVFNCRLWKSFGRGNSAFVTVRLAHPLNLVIGTAPVERLIVQIMGMEGGFWREKASASEEN